MTPVECILHAKMLSYQHLNDNCIIGSWKFSSCYGRSWAIIVYIYSLFVNLLSSWDVMYVWKSLSDLCYSGHLFLLCTFYALSTSFQVLGEIAECVYGGRILQASYDNLAHIFQTSFGLFISLATVFFRQNW